MGEEADAVAVDTEVPAPLQKKQRQNKEWQRLADAQTTLVPPQYQEHKQSYHAKQQQCEKEFVAHKRQVLMNLSSNACDHSPKGGVDRKCLPLMQLLNTHEDYVTTSSCSGRIALFHSVAIAENCGAAESAAAVKRGDKDALGWLLVKHEALTEREVEFLVHALCDGAEGSVVADAAGAAGRQHEEGQREGELDGVWVREGVLRASSLPAFGLVALKMEPFVMHVACRTMESAKWLLSAAAADAGFRNSGVTPPGKKIICGIRHAAGLGFDVPLVMDGVNYVMGQHAYVRRLLQMANTKMHSNDVRLRRLEAAVAARLDKRGATEG
ncbi:tRNA wybutosine-synthesizing protein 3 [Trypanosoma rangeli]|uniref:tRNA(Phe) 7-[(3-amino-3-carboxypropyl)-4-demethylwyosine(37)-N(4)]-methyltransferase n=1 Tax=Trypanosoma rangeli TaxID=5698 RepID=A0A3S5IRY7_TRYRA|nr:tRNA wybutosine-synthesizing protein 3 [Trypanosoma rangeli]RNF09343.1 tRNA wybutosine-synthesizing protein 3 [Trypanosoma rangeli]|eukprot:RNF09343.1 tRNA wybutosine-synthesizing protein 3 [Trypanosoma rangeli]